MGLNCRLPLAAKLLIGSKKVRGCNDGMDLLYHRAKFGGNRTTHVGVRGWSVMFSVFFVNNARTLNGRKWRSCIIQEEIASVFVSRFRCGLHLFSGRKSSFQRIQDLKIVARWRYDWCTNFRNLRKWVQSLCARHHFGHLEARWKRKVRP